MYGSFVSCSCCDWLINVCQRKKELKARTVWLGCPEKCEEKHPRNSIKNQKYNIFTFIPGVRWFYLQCQLFVFTCYFCLPPEETYRDSGCWCHCLSMPATSRFPPSHSRLPLCFPVSVYLRKCTVWSLLSVLDKHFCYWSRRV